MTAEMLVFALLGYAAVGLAFAAAFVTAGVARLDPAARGTSWRFRALIVPGSALLWPLLLGRWLALEGGRP